MCPEISVHLPVHLALSQQSSPLAITVHFILFHEVPRELCLDSSSSAPPLARRRWSMCADQSDARRSSLFPQLSGGTHAGRPAGHDQSVPLGHSLLAVLFQFPVPSLDQPDDELPRRNQRRRMSRDLRRIAQLRRGSSQSLGTVQHVHAGHRFWNEGKSLFNHRVRLSSRIELLLLGSGRHAVRSFSSEPIERGRVPCGFPSSFAPSASRLVKPSVMKLNVFVPHFDPVIVNPYLLGNHCSSAVVSSLLRRALDDLFLKTTLAGAVRQIYDECKITGRERERERERRMKRKSVRSPVIVFRRYCGKQ